MRKGIALFTLLALVLSSAAFASNDITKAPIRNLKFIGTNDDPAPPPALPLSQHRLPRNPLDLIGTTYTGGTTWYDYQHNGTTGKMLDVDDNGWVHIVWMNGLNESSSNRHVFYNYWIPDSMDFVTPVGVQIDASQRAGYVSQATSNDGRCYPVFHQQTSSENFHGAASIDLLPQSGAYATFEPAYLWDAVWSDWMEIIWPHVAQSTDEDLHMSFSENPLSGIAGDPQKIYYARGVPDINEAGFGEEILFQPVSGEDELLLIDTVMVLAVDVAASRYTDKIVMAWCESRDNLAIPDSATQRNNDVVYIVSNDGGETWGPEINITNFAYPDLECQSGDTAVCNADTFRVYTDLSLMLDEEDNVHIAFTTTHYWSLEGTISRWASQIWHWGEATGEISPIRAVDSDYFSVNWAADIGDWQNILQRPNLAIDPMTGYLYASYQFSDTLQFSELGIPIADAYVAVSTDCGRSWSAGTNVTETTPDDGGQGTPAGQCTHERDITLGELVTYEDGVGYLHMEYIFDLDAGGSIGANPIGVPTLNPVMYQRIPVTELPAEPRFDHTWPQIHVDGSQVPYDGDPNPTFGGPCFTDVANDNVASLPEKFLLHQNYPNPFNPSTRIQFDLAQSMNVTLTVFNVLGQNVATLLNSERMNAGVQVIDFDATNLPSGVYVYQLEANGLTQSRKMVLLK